MTVDTRIPKIHGYPHDPKVLVQIRVQREVIRQLKAANRKARLSPRSR